jgi:hypothetical protein
MASRPQIQISTLPDPAWSLNDQLARLWAAGQTLGQIERSTGLSRGVAIGHIYRARKAGDPRFQPRPPRSPPLKVRKLKPADEAVGNRRPPPPAPPETMPVPFLALRSGACKFPLNSPARGRLCDEMLCCGKSVVRPGANYCGQHEALTRSSPTRISPFRAPQPE